MLLYVCCCVLCFVSSVCCVLCVLAAAAVCVLLRFCVCAFRPLTRAPRAAPRPHPKTHLVAAKLRARLLDDRRRHDRRGLPAISVGQLLDDGVARHGVAISIYEFVKAVVGEPEAVHELVDEHGHGGVGVGGGEVVRADVGGALRFGAV